MTDQPLPLDSDLDLPSPADILDTHRYWITDLGTGVFEVRCHGCDWKHQYSPQFDLAPPEATAQHAAHQVQMILEAGWAMVPVEAVVDE